MLVLLLNFRKNIPFYCVSFPECGVTKDSRSTAAAARLRGTSSFAAHHA